MCMLTNSRSYLLVNSEPGKEKEKQEMSFNAAPRSLLYLKRSETQTEKLNSSQVTSLLHFSATFSIIYTPAPVFKKKSEVTSVLWRRGRFCANSCNSG